MRVIFCQPTLNRSGSENSLLQMLHALEGHPRITSIKVLAGQDGPMRAALEKYAEVEVIHAPKLDRRLSRLGAFLKSFFSTYRTLKQCVKHADTVVYVNTLMFPQAFLAGFLSRLPVIVHIREVATTYPLGVYRTYMWLAAACATRLVAACDFVFAQPQASSMVRRPHYVIYNAAPGNNHFLSRFVREPYRILAVIPCTVRKGILDLVDCVKHLRYRLPPGADFQVDVVGPIGHDRTLNDVRDRLKRDGTGRHFQFHGELPDVDELFRSAHVLLHPSHSECFPRVLVEACGFSLPCVATDVGGVSELIVDGVTGFLVPRGASEDMASRLARLLTNQDLHRTMAQNAFAAFQAKHSLPSLQMTLARLLEDVATGAN
jgi:glycosyltransferase involved in cell wall biosynthesis